MPRLWLALLTGAEIGQQGYADQASTFLVAGSCPSPKITDAYQRHCRLVLACKDLDKDVCLFCAEIQGWRP